MPDLTKEEHQERAQLVRLHEANCQIAHPTETDLKFRLAVQKKLAQAFGFSKEPKTTSSKP